MATTTKLVTETLAQLELARNAQQRLKRELVGLKKYIRRAKDYQEHCKKYMTTLGLKLRQDANNDEEYQDTKRYYESQYLTLPKNKLVEAKSNLEQCTLKLTEEKQKEEQLREKLAIYEKQLRQEYRTASSPCSECGRTLSWLRNILHELNTEDSYDDTSITSMQTCLAKQLKTLQKVLQTSSNMLCSEKQQ